MGPVAAVSLRTRSPPANGGETGGFAHMPPITYANKSQPADTPNSIAGTQINRRSPGFIPVTVAGHTRPAISQKLSSYVSYTNLKKKRYIFSDYSLEYFFFYYYYNSLDERRTMKNTRSFRSLQRIKNHRFIYNRRQTSSKMSCIAHYSFANFNNINRV